MKLNLKGRITAMMAALAAVGVMAIGATASTAAAAPAVASASAPAVVSASASTRYCSSTAAYYGTVSKVHTICYDNYGRHLVAQSNYDTRNPWYNGSEYLMLEGSEVQVWSGGRYMVVSPYGSWLPSSHWTIQFKDWLYRKVNGKWVFVKMVYSKVWR